MKTRYSGPLVLALAALLGVGGVLLAQQQDDADPDVRIQAGDVDVQADVDRQAQLQRDNLQETAAREKASVFRASALIGMDVQNTAGTDLGEIEDVTIHEHTGKVEYVAISFGGFLDIQDKLFAVPWDRLHIKRVGDPQDDDWIAVMDVTKETLERAQGFNQDDWPEKASDAFPEVDRGLRATERAERDDTTPRR